MVIGGKCEAEGTDSVAWVRISVAGDTALIRKRCWVVISERADGTFDVDGVDSVTGELTAPAVTTWLLPPTSRVFITE